MISTRCNENILVALKCPRNRNLPDPYFVLLFGDFNVIKIKFISSSRLPGHPKKQVVDM